MQLQGTKNQESDSAAGVKKEISNKGMWLCVQNIITSVCDRRNRSKNMYSKASHTHTSTHMHTHKVARYIYVSTKIKMNDFSSIACYSHHTYNGKFSGNLPLSHCP